MTTTRRLQGAAALNAMFARAQAQSRAAFLPYFPIGYPTHAESLAAIAALAAAGADGFEIGIPFSDPIADGPTIQAATQIALENGTTVRDCLDAVRALREQGIDQPMLLMGYANPLLAYGTDRFVRDACAAGADGSCPTCRQKKPTTSPKAAREKGWRWYSCWRPPATTPA